MSAPTLAVVLAEHAGKMLVEIADALNRHGSEVGYGDGFARVRVEHSPNTTHPFHAYIDEMNHTFYGSADDAGRALLNANSDRQSFYENRKRELAA